jgi:methyltransferase (TIGR00027 family)
LVVPIESDIASVDVSDKVIGASALIDLRLHHPLAKHQHVCGHHDQFFWVQAGSEWAAMLVDADPLYAPFVIARHRWFAERLQRAADQAKQILVLGAGFDGRPMSLVQLGLGQLQVFEVDCPDVIETKLDILARHRVVMPLGLHHVAAELDDALLKAKLAAAGYRRDLPTVVLMEGKHFLLPRPTAELLLDPRSLGLAAGSSVVMDFWTAPRQEAMNAKIEPRLGHQLFGENPLGDSMESAALYLQDRGYGDIELISLDRLCARYGIAAERDPLLQSWLILEAQVL